MASSYSDRLFLAQFSNRQESPTIVRLSHLNHCESMFVFITNMDLSKKFEIENCLKTLQNFLDSCVVNYTNNQSFLDLLDRINIFKIHINNF